MSWTPTDEQVEKAARDLLIRERGSELPWERWHPDVHQGYLDIARAVLVAVGPTIAAQALRDAGPDLPGDMSKYARRDTEDFLRHRADTIEKEAGR